MTMRLPGLRVLSICLIAFMLAGGCGEGDGDDQGPPSPPGAAGEVPGGGPGSGAPGIKQIMIKLAKGPNSLTPVIGKELGENPPPWETIQAQTKEYAQSASEMGKYDPPKGTKESWITLTKAFAGLAADLDRAAAAKNKENARTAHDQLKNSCTACHDEHRKKGRGGGGPPGFGRGGPPSGGPGGPPPGGPPAGGPQ